MRPVLLLLLLLSFALSAALGAWAADVPVKVFVNGKAQSYNPPALARDGKTYVPLRQGAESLGYTVEWLPAENGAKVCDNDSCLLIRKNEGLVVNGALFLPLRKMSESFGAKVSWDPKRKAVVITK